MANTSRRAGTGLFGALIMLALICFWNPPQSLAEASDPEESFTEIWQFRDEQLGIIKNRTEELTREAEKLAGQLAYGLRDRRQELKTRQQLYQESAGNPVVQNNVLAQMQVMRNRFVTSVEPVKELALEADNLLEGLNKQEEALVEFLKGQKAYRNQSSPRIRRNVQEAENYVLRINQAQMEVEDLKARVADLLTPIEFIEDELSTGITDYEADLAKLWDTYYTGSAWHDNAQAKYRAGRPDQELETQLALAYQLKPEDFLTALRRGALILGLLAAAAFLGYRAAGRLPDLWRKTCRKILTSSWISFSLGASLLIGGLNPDGGRYLMPSTAGSLLLLWGICTLSWRLRLTAEPSLAGKPSPLYWLYGPAALGLIMLAVNVPLVLTTVIWLIVAAVCLIFLFHINRKYSDLKLPVLEHLFYESAFYFMLVSLIIAAAGFGRPAILLVVIGFAVFNILTFVAALTDLLTILINTALDARDVPISNAFLRALATPLCWALALVSPWPWLWALPGSNYILEHIGQARFTFRSATLDLMTVVLLLLLFFGFRSFISLIKSVLAELPEKTREVQPGAVVPMQKVVSFFLWLGFILAALALVGVNLIGIAVVAGGLSVGLGFGLQNFFNNLISGLTVLFGQSVLVGDQVKIGNIQGIVRDINIRAVTVETENKALVYVPNAKIVTGQLTNLTRKDRSEEEKLTMIVSIEADLDKIAQMFVEAALKQPAVHKNPPPRAVISKPKDGDAAEIAVILTIENADDHPNFVSELQSEFGEIIRRESRKSDRVEK